MASSDPATDADVEFVVKRSSDLNAKDLKLILPSQSSLADVKLKLTEEYADHPHPATMTVRNT
jgi:hypothetical protein